MLSVNTISANVSSGGGARSYIDYVREQVERYMEYNAREKGVDPGKQMGWLGSNPELFKHYGINPDGDFDFKHVEALISGVDPRDGKTPLVREANNGQNSKCLGKELCFSWDKTESIVEALASPAEQTAIRNRHEQILQMCVKKAEKFIYGRVSEDGERGKETVLGTMAFFYEHQEARPVAAQIADPQKHYHGFIPNIAFFKDENGEIKTSSLDTHELFEMQKTDRCLLPEPEG